MVAVPVCDRRVALPLVLARVLLAGVLLAGVLLSWGSCLGAEPAGSTEIERTAQARQSSVTAASTVVLVDELPPGTNSLADVLRGLPGVAIRDLGGLGKLSTMSLRGATSQQVCVYLDGRSLAPPGGGAVDLSAVNLRDIERIEVLRGPAAARYGSECLGGAVLLFSRRREGSGGSLGSHAGSYSTSERFGQAHAGLKLGGQRLSVQTEARQFVTAGNFPYRVPDLFRSGSVDGGRPRREHNAAERWHAGLRLAGQGESLRWSIESRYQEADLEIPGPLNNLTPLARQQEQQHSASLGLAWLTGGKRLTEWGLDFEREDRRFRYTNPSQDGLFLPVATRQTGDKLALNLWGQGSWGELRWRGDLVGRQEQLHASGQSYQRRRTEAGLHVDGLSWQGRLAWTATLRGYSEGENSDLTGGLGTRLLLGADWALRANLARTSRTPTFTELYQEAGYVTSNPALGPERALAGDIGVVYQRQRFRAEATVFLTHYEDLIRYVAVAGFRYKPFNLGERWAHGAELAAQYSPWKFLSLEASYTYTRLSETLALSRERGRQVPGQPIDTALLRLRGEAGVLSAWLEFTTQGETALNEANTALLPRQEVWSAGVSLNLEPVTLAIECRNLLGRSRYDAAYYPLPPQYLGGTLTCLW